MMIKENIELNGKQNKLYKKQTNFMFCSMYHRIAATADNFKQLIIIQFWHGHF